MVTLFFVFSIVALAWLFKKNLIMDCFTVPFIVLAMIAACSSAQMLEDIYDLTTSYVIDEKIEMYSQQNEEIEKCIGDSVKAYMDYEKETYGTLSNKDAMNLVILYPELKSDQLVSYQMDVYVNNMDKITKLKVEKIDLAKARWRLYFGH